MRGRNGSGAKGLPHLAGAEATTTGSGRIEQATAKPLPVSKRQVWEAYKKVKAKGGAAGVDGQTVEEFEKNVTNNLYKLWNRLASGSYMPPAVKRVEIPKAGGGVRPLVVPTVADRIAQTVIKDILEPIMEPLFHEDSYGWRYGAGVCNYAVIRRWTILRACLTRRFEDGSTTMESFISPRCIRHFVRLIANWFCGQLVSSNACVGIAVVPGIGSHG